MPLITDPDSLSQGTLTNASGVTLTAPGTGADATITSASTMPALAAGEFFEMRDWTTAGNDGLYVVVTVNTSTSSYEVDKITGTAPVSDGADPIRFFGATGASTEKSVHFDTNTNIFYLFEQGNMDTAGTTMLAFHSFAKEEWKFDQDLMDRAGFPMVGISFAAGQWQFGVDPSGNYNGWKPADDDVTNGIYTKQLVRNAGWEQFDSNGILTNSFFNVTTLGAFEDTANDQAHYRFGTDATDTGAATNYVYAGSPVNEPIEFYTEIGDLSGDTPSFATTSTITRTTGSFITDGFIIGGQVTINDSTSNDGTWEITGVAALTLTLSGTPLTVEAWGTSRIAVNNNNNFTTYIRVRDADPNGKTYGQAGLADAGETQIDAKVIKFPLSNATDTNIAETDANIGANSPYTQIVLRYFDQAFNREVDSATNRNFGIVADVGTHSGVDGSFSAAGTVLTSSEGGINAFGAGTYNGGVLRIHEGTDENTEFTIASHTDTTITISGGSFTATETNISFTAQRATPVSATKQQIFEKVQYQLRQNSDIDVTDQTVIGRIADELMVFVGPDLQCGSTDGGVSFPTNPNGGGSGVIIEGFDSNDTNNLFFYDNTGTRYNFPFVAAGTITFSQNLVDDSDGEYWMFYDYTVRTTNSDIDTVTPSGDSYDLEGTLGTYAVGDYIRVSGFAQAANNGLFIVTAVNVSGSDYTVRKVDGTAVGTAETNQTVSVDEHPWPSPDAIIVNNNAGSPIQGAVNATSVTFDFDYENNTQGGRTADTTAAVILVAGGFETAQMAVVKNLTISKATGLSFSVTAAQERNAENL